MQNITDLRETLFDTIEKLKSGKIDVARANAISQVAGRIIETAKVEVDFLKLPQRDSSFFKLESADKLQLREPISEEESKDWTDIEDTMVRNYYHSYTIERLQKSALPRRTIEEIEERAVFLKIKKKIPVAKSDVKNGFKPATTVSTGTYDWSAQDDEVLLEYYKTMTAVDLEKDYFPGVPLEEIKLRYSQLMLAIEN